MPPRHVVVDGSNLATEGRSLPSLAQLDEAVRAYKEEWPDHDVLVVVDASFSYRIDDSEREVFEGAENAGEVVSPPAGALGRGDGFLLRIADRTDAVVLSNDSFQEFHGEYAWLFDEGRLVGGKPVPGVGWIFTPRSPVRGPKSRVSVRDAKTKRRAPRAEPVAQAIAEATAEAVSPDPEPTSARRSGRRRGRAPAEASPEAINEPLPFITFIAEHHLGTAVEGTVDSFTSHGAFVVAEGARCYAPVVGLGDPPPRSAKDVLTRGETRTFIVQALDPPRRGIELALPGLARVAGAPTEETVEAEIDEAAQPSRRRRGARVEAPEAVEQVPFEELKPTPPPRAGRKRAAARLPSEPVVEPAPEPVAVTEPVPAATGPRRNTARGAPATASPPAAPVGEPAASSVKKARTPRKAAAKKAAAMIAEPVPGEVPAAAPAVPAKKAAAKKAPAKKAPAKKAATKAPAKKAPAKKAPARKAPARKAPAEKVTAEKVAVKTAARTSAAKKAVTKKAPATKAAAEKVVTKRAVTKRAAKKAAPAPTG